MEDMRDMLSMPFILCLAYRMPEDFDIPRLIIVLQPMLRMARRKRKSLRNFLVNNNIDLNSSIRSSEKQSVQSVLLILGRWSP